MAFMILPTIASISEDAMRRCRRACARAPTASAPRKLQVSLRVVFPAALSGIVASIVLGVSRAVGETMIVLIAAGQLANSGIDPREPFETMTAFIAATGKGDVADREDRVQDDLRRGDDAVPADPGR